MTERNEPETQQTLREMRDAYGITQAAMAIKLGMRREQLSYLEGIDLATFPQRYMAVLGDILMERSENLAQEAVRLRNQVSEMDRSSEVNN